MSFEDYQKLNIEVVLGKAAPRYEADVSQLTIQKAVITEHGMESGLPLVDLQLVDDTGKLHFAMISGRLINELSKSIEVVASRLHGSEEP